MNYFKVLKENMESPVMDFRYTLNKTYMEKRFDTSGASCSRGLYYLKPWQIFNWFDAINAVLYEVIIGGKVKELDKKNRCSKMTIIKKVDHKIFVEICLKNINEILTEDRYENFIRMNNILLTTRKLFRKYDKNNKYKRPFIQSFIRKFFYGHIYIGKPFTKKELTDILYGFFITLKNWDKQ